MRDIYNRQLKKQSNPPYPPLLKGEKQGLFFISPFEKGGLRGILFVVQHSIKPVLTMLFLLFLLNLDLKSNDCFPDDHLRVDWMEGDTTSVNVDNVDLYNNISIECSPNPFNGSIQISYSLKISGYYEAGIIDILGRQILSIKSDWMASGTYSAVWDGNDAVGNRLGDGIYFVLIRSVSRACYYKLLLLDSIK